MQTVFNETAEQNTLAGMHSCLEILEKDYKEKVQAFMHRAARKRGIKLISRWEAFLDSESVTVTRGYTLAALRFRGHDVLVICENDDEVIGIPLKDVHYECLPEIIDIFSGVIFKVDSGTLLVDEDGELVQNDN